MGLLTVIRHTRAEERSGRAELVRANVVGRHAQLTAALILTTLMAIVVALLITGMMVGRGYAPVGSLAFGTSVAVSALAFAGVAAITAQVSEYPRATAAIAGAVLGAAFVLRAIGDMAYVQDSGPTWLSWLSPIGWSQQAAPYTFDRWWPLLISAAFTVVTVAIGYRLSARRDLGSGLVPPRPGSPRAAAWLSSPLALTFRLQRAGLVGWSSAVFIGGGSYGSFSQALLDGFADAPEEMIEVMGGADDLLGGYLGLIGLMWAFTITVYAILAVQSLRSEETDGRTEPVLATAVSRSSWIGSHLTVTGLAVPWLLLLAGLGDGIGAAASTGDVSLLGEVVLGHVAHTPAVWLVLTIATLLYAAVPRVVPLIWVVLVYALVVGFFGPLLEIPDAGVSVSPFEHIGEHPAESISVAAAMILTLLSAIVGAAAILSFRRRDIITTA
jgi:ABC-2 type transport system permease protein